MPVRLFTDAERERLDRFPRDISPADLLAFFTLSDDDLELIGDRRSQTQEAIEVQEIVGVRRKRVGRTCTGVKVPEESSNFWDRVLLVVQKLE